jgi:hypothetical protein
MSGVYVLGVSIFPLSTICYLILEVTKKAQGKIDFKKNIVERNLLIPALINLGLKIIHFTCTGPSITQLQLSCGFRT